MSRLSNRRAKAWLPDFVLIACNIGLLQTRKSAGQYVPPTSSLRVHGGSMQVTNHGGYLLLLNPKVYDHNKWSFTLAIPVAHSPGARLKGISIAKHSEAGIYDSRVEKVPCLCGNQSQSFI